MLRKSPGTVPELSIPSTATNIMAENVKEQEKQTYQKFLKYTGYQRKKHADRKSLKQ
jgi:hypothetical protein